MPDPRAMLDPRWHWLQSAFRRLYAELEPGDHIDAIILGVRDRDGQLIHYGLDPTWPHMHKAVVTGDQDELSALYEANTVNVNPEVPS